MRNRHAPQRSCIMCSAKMAKRDLFRIVLTPEQECIVDATGKRPGRGAYLCGRPDCWRGAARGKRLAAALRGEITPGRPRAAGGVRAGADRRGGGLRSIGRENG